MLGFSPYLVLLFSAVVAWLTAHGHPRLLGTLNREDGPVEWATVTVLLFLAWILLRDLPKLGRVLPGWQKAGGWLLFVLALLAAGEEISWGQRIFGWETGERMQELNLQSETNLHNLVPPLLFNGLIIFALGIGFVLIPLLWRSFRTNPPDWVPAREHSLLMLAAIMINHYDFGHPIEWFGLAVMLAILAVFTVMTAVKRRWAEFAACLAGWFTACAHYTQRHILHEANHQYETRELLIVLLALIWAKGYLDLRKARASEETGAPH